MERYICVHAHFSQPPRENPWLEEIELQDSACPYHDWNEVVTAQSYAPNTAARIMDAEGRITAIINNYSMISFDFDPSLLGWLSRKSPEVYDRILEADAKSQARFGGHGCALAQPYGHAILPLASQRDKYTYIWWGIRDFQERFKRRPEGIWLAECAVDLETLAVLADMGIRFTILAPHQASKVRPKGKRLWRDASGGRINTGIAYEVQLAGGRKMNLFFYDATISHAIAFEDLLESGDRFATRLMDRFSDDPGPALVHVATDGETYGYFRRHGDMALAYALNHIESNRLAKLTNYGQYLEKHPPDLHVLIAEPSSRNCFHGIERWRTDCGCNTGTHPGWNYGWRAPLRRSLDYLRDAVAPLFEATGRTLLKDPWAARDDYLSVIQDRSQDNLDRFIARHASSELGMADRVTVLRLLELQRYALLMYSSFGWFFDDLSGPEATQNLKYAARVMQLADELFGQRLESPFLDLLRDARSNLPDFGDGRQIYEAFVGPAVVDLAKVGAHYAMSSLFDLYGERVVVYTYCVERHEFHVLRAGESSVAFGKATVTSLVTGETLPLFFGVLHLGDHNVDAGVKPLDSDNSYQALARDASASFNEGDLPQVLRILDKHFGASTFSLKTLFRDEQRHILDYVLASTVAEAEASYRRLHDHHGPLLQFLHDLGAPLPLALQAATDLVLNTDLRRSLEQHTLDLNRLNGIVEEAGKWKVGLDLFNLEYHVGRITDPLARDLRTKPEDLSRLQELNSVVDTIRSLPVAVNLWRLQNAFYEVLVRSFPEQQRKAAGNNPQARSWVNGFRELGHKLGVLMPAPIDASDGDL